MDKRPAAKRWRDYIKHDLSTDCWIWTGPRRGRYGYISVSSNGHRTQRAVHVFVYEQMVGPVPVGKELDHTCRVRLCVNPLHLDPVTHAENIRRGLKGVLRTRCKFGHELTPENTRVVKSVRGTSRICRTCERKWKREYARRRRAAGLRT